MRKMIAGMLAVAVCWGAGWALAADGAALAGKVCSACHGMGKVESAYGAKDKDAWTATVDRMLAKKGAPAVSAEERAAIIDWLAEQK
jgi:mono/diheme cytochrome c family protein